MDKPRRRLTWHAGIAALLLDYQKVSGDCVVSPESAAALLPTTREVTLSCASETGGERYISEGSGEAQPLRHRSVRQPHQRYAHYTYYLK